MKFSMFTLCLFVQLIVLFPLISAINNDDCCANCRASGLSCPNSATVYSDCSCWSTGGCISCTSQLAGLSIFLIVFLPILAIVSVILCCRYVAGCPFYYRRHLYPQMGVVYGGQPAIAYGQPIVMASPVVNGQVVQSPQMYAPYATPAPYGQQQFVQPQQYAEQQQGQQQYAQQYPPNSPGYQIGSIPTDTYAQPPAQAPYHQGESTTYGSTSPSAPVSPYNNTTA